MCSLEDTKEALIIELEQTKCRVVELEAAHSDLDARSKDLARQRAEWEEGIGEHEQGKNYRKGKTGQSGRRVSGSTNRVRYPGRSLDCDGWP